MSKPAELFYTVGELAVMHKRCERVIRERCRRGDYGDGVILDEKEYLIPASGVNAWVEKRRVFPADSCAAPIAARTEGEARRKHRDRGAGGLFLPVSERR